MSNRRDFIGLLGGAAAVWPLAARAEQRKVPVIGAFHAASREGTAHLMAAYREGLKEQGYVEGLNVAIEYRWANGVLDRMPAIMAELVRLQPDVITAFGLPLASPTMRERQVPRRTFQLCSRSVSTQL